MTYHFCTLFDKNYLIKGLALYNSFIKYCPESKFWILCMDEMTCEILGKLRLKNAILVPISRLESKELLAAKSDRNPGEYSWTCKPRFILDILENNPQINDLAYLDSDQFFFSSPDPIYQEMGPSSIGITPHRFIADKDELEHKRGKYNAGFVFFKNNDDSKLCLEWWAQRCLEWCYHRLEDGKLGDQLYLNSFQEQFKNVHDIRNPGVNLGPWNINQYDIRSSGGEVSVNGQKLILYHFHSFTLYKDLKLRPLFDQFKISGRNYKLIHEPYIAALRQAASQIRAVDNNFNLLLADIPNISSSLKKLIKKYLLPN